MKEKNQTLDDLIDQATEETDKNSFAILNNIIDNYDCNPIKPQNECEYELNSIHQEIEKIENSNTGSKEFLLKEAKKIENILTELSAESAKIADTNDGLNFNKELAALGEILADKDITEFMEYHADIVNNYVGVFQMFLNDLKKNPCFYFIPDLYDFEKNCLNGIKKNQDNFKKCIDNLSNIPYPNAYTESAAAELKEITKDVLTKSEELFVIFDNTNKSYNKLKKVKNELEEFKNEEISKNQSDMAI